MVGPLGLEPRTSAYPKPEVSVIKTPVLIYQSGVLAKLNYGPG